MYSPGKRHSDRDIDQFPARYNRFNLAISTYHDRNLSLDRRNFVSAVNPNTNKTAQRDVTLSPPKGEVKTPQHNRRPGLGQQVLRFHQHRHEGAGHLLQMTVKMRMGNQRLAREWYVIFIIKNIHPLILFETFCLALSSLSNTRTKFQLRCVTS